MHSAIRRLRLGRSQKPQRSGQYQPCTAMLSQIEPPADTLSHVEPASAALSQIVGPIAILSQLQPRSATSRKWSAEHTGVCEANVVWRDRPMCDAHAA